MGRDLIIHDGTGSDVLFPRHMGRGFSRSPGAPMNASASSAVPFPSSLIIPRAEWQARVQEKEATKTRLIDLCDQAGLKVKNQQRTEFCWGNAPVHCLEITRVLQNEAPVELSAASVCAQITNYRNVGGYGPQALDFIAANGVTPVSAWPVNAIDPRYATAANKTLALKYRCAAWYAIDPSNFDEIFSALLLNLPVAVGLSWWGHEISYVAPRWIDGAPAVDFDNSWGEAWGNKGRGTLQGNRMMPDDASAPYVALAS